MKHPAVVMLFWISFFAHMADREAGFAWLRVVFYLFAAATVIGQCLTTMADSRRQRMFSSLAHLALAALLFRWGGRTFAVFIAFLGVLPLAVAEAVHVSRAARG